MTRIGVIGSSRLDSISGIQKKVVCQAKDLPTNCVICGDSEVVLKSFPDNCIGLIVTSPPYVDRRKNTYGGVPPNKYVEWFLAKSIEFLRILKPTGTFILNIKENAESELN